MPGVLEPIVLLDREGADLLETYGRKVREESELNIGNLAGYMEARDLYDIPWSSRLDTVKPRIAQATRAGATYTVERTDRRDQRTVRLTLGGVV